MLKQRVITALILAPLVITAVWLLPTDIVALLLALVVGFGAREWATLSGISHKAGQWLYTLFVLLVMLCVYLFLPPAWIFGVIGLSVLWWLLALFRLSRYQGEAERPGLEPLRVFEGLVVLVPAWLSLVVIHRTPENGPVLMLFLLILIWSADVGAYFAGHRWGSNKLAPQVSPGKTREGVYGAMASALLCGLFLVWWFDTRLSQVPLILMLCLVTMLFSVVGDLFESLLKRRQGMKDSGMLLPGHGGMLDRIDSLTAAAPVFLLGLMLFGEAG
ncbi:MAG: phosphatidate cytidylyltransferase [Candidatus Thiodiazotropha sp. (ex Gloverina cf. vestifex)]|nr:phosphatidate cytidylyltransferase [Candidatus Thiodiazotropha sp. (ex Gloverina cf. vestifex)]